ncbi:MAG: caspase family protein [Fibrobacteres bacterium]|nr:caspase family protein [Fibrobacterota bacterium]
MKISFRSTGYALALAIAALSGIPASVAPASFASKSAVSAPAGPASAPLRRFALAVGVNDGGPARVRLRYAGSDAANFAAVMERFGGVASRDMRVLREPGRREFLEALASMRSAVAAANAAGQRAELLVYYSGHSDEAGLLLGRDRLDYSEFRSRIDSIPARIRLAVVDACASGALTRIKGGSRLPAFSVDQSSNLSGYAFLTSSSGAEASQESDRIRASYFTHYLVSGLRGAADRNQDGRVTLGEAYAFAFQETLAQTEGSQAGAQHPSYDMRLTGTGDLVLTDLRGTSAGLVLAPAVHGRLFVRSSAGDLVAELHKQSGAKMELGLEPGIYDLDLDQGDSLFHALVKLDTLEHAPVSRADLNLVARESTRNRGEAGPAAASIGAPDTAPSTEPREKATAIPATWIPARAAVVPSLGYPGSGAGPWSHNLSVNLLSGRAQDINGLQFSLGGNRAEGRVAGVQFSLMNFASGPSTGLQYGVLANAQARNHTGFQLSFVANNADSLTGLQAGAINHAGRLEGVQAGAINAAGIGDGIQLGGLNVAESQRGLQAGLVNIADSSRGLQAGLFNYATHGEGLVLGLVSVVRNGMHDAEATFDDRSMLRTAFLLGGPYNYNYLSFDMKARYPRHLWGGSAGVGVHIPLAYAFVDLDAGGGLVFNDVDWDNQSYTARFRLIGGYAPSRWFNVFGGFTANLEMWPASRFPNLNPDRKGERWGDEIRAEKWPGFVVGVRI